MKLTDARKLASGLIKKHHLHPKFSFILFNEEDFSEEYKSWVAFYDATDERNFHIGLERKFVKASDSVVVRDVILHEIAHCLDHLVRGHSNHDAFYKSICKKIGCDPSPSLEMK
ncbi:MAG: SprT-like domain-containing protein [Candidatus Ranarchaeia archaeon]|jgi:hypothetical protein